MRVHPFTDDALVYMLSYIDESLEVLHGLWTRSAPPSCDAYAPSTKLCSGGKRLE